MVTCCERYNMPSGDILMNTEELSPRSLSEQADGRPNEGDGIPGPQVEAEVRATAGSSQPPPELIVGTSEAEFDRLMAEGGAEAVVLNLQHASHATDPTRAVPS